MVANILLKVLVASSVSNVSRWDLSIREQKIIALIKKADILVVNTLKIVLGKFQDLKDEICEWYKTTRGTSYVIHGKVIQNWDNLVKNEDSYDSNVLHD